MNYTMSLSLNEMLESSIKRLKHDIEKDLRQRANDIVTEEVAKLAIDLSSYVQVNRIGNELQITIRDIRDSNK